MPALAGLMHDHLDHGLGLFTRQDRLTHDGARGLVFSAAAMTGIPPSSVPASNTRKKRLNMTHLLFSIIYRKAKGRQNACPRPFLFGGGLLCSIPGCVRTGASLPAAPGQPTKKRPLCGQEECHVQ